MTVPEYDIATAGEMIDAGTLSSAELCQTFLDRVAQIDRAGPTLRSVIELNADANAIARDLDLEAARNGPRSVLHGAPILVKDNIDSADTMKTTAGSLAMEGNRPAKDAHCRSARNIDPLSGVIGVQF